MNLTRVVRRITPPYFSERWRADPIMKTPPEDVKLSREDGEALIARVQANALTGEDRRLLVRLIRVYFESFRWACLTAKKITVEPKPVRS